MDLVIYDPFRVGTFAATAKKWEPFFHQKIFQAYDAERIQDIKRPLDRKNNSKTRYRVSFKIKPLTGEHFCVFEGKGYCYNGFCPKDVVVKALKNYSASSADFETDLFCNDTARMLAQRFNKLFDGFGVEIRFVVPTRTRIDQRATLTKLYKKFKKEEAIVVEERLNGKFMHFISNRGASLQNDMDIAVLGAFSHFTYQQSGGSFVVCGLKGIRKTNTSEFTLTNPTIHSKNGTFGSKDKRDAGIIDFKINHKCNSFCEVFKVQNTLSSSNIENGSDEY